MGLLNMTPFEPLLAGLLGLLIGSFLNVCIYRFPRDLSIVRPRSHCPQCNAMVRAWDNIPVLSYLLLRGKCRDCGAPISIRYPIVECATALLFAWFVARYGLTLPALRGCVLTAILLALVFTDLETRLLPEQLTLAAIGFGLGFSLLVPVPDGTAGLLFRLNGRAASLTDSLMGALLPSLALWGTGWIFEKLRHKEGLGFGDVVLLSAIGAFLGLRGALLTLVIASLAGSVVGLIYIRIKGEDMGSYPLPLGSFLSAAGIFAAAFGGPVIRWYSGAFS
jgi:leader peptidase (prepilin peptidase)/N-methyltransferase